MTFLNFITSIIAFAIWCLVVYYVVRAAVISALDQHRGKLGEVGSLLATQADLTARLAKHLTAQTDLMLIQANHEGISDAQLEPVLKQVAERKADPEPSFPTSLPFK